MSAQQQPLHAGFSSFDNVSTWLCESGEGKPIAGETATLAADVRALSDRVRRVRSRSTACAGIELSPYVKSLAKMVGSMDMITPPSDRSPYTS